MYDRDAREPAFRLNHRILAFFAVDLYEAAMTTTLEGDKTFFLPFNQGSNGPGADGGKGNPQTEDCDYVTSYLWKNVLQKDSLLDILQKFPVIYEEVSDTTGKRFAIIVDEAHSSQTGSSAMKMKVALADTSDDLKEYAEIEGKAEEEILDSIPQAVPHLREMVLLPYADYAHVR